VSKTLAHIEEITMNQIWTPSDSDKESWDANRVEVGVSEYLFGAEFKTDKQTWIAFKLIPSNERKKIVARNKKTGEEKHFTVVHVIKATNFIALRSWLDKNNLEAFLL